jgi:putative spermidine/putrescine transport system substrate-binding protein
MRSAVLLLLFALVVAGCGDAPTAERDLLRSDWAEVEAEARGQTVTVAMWQGDPFINDYMRAYVAPRLAAEHGVTLEFVALQGNQIVSALVTEAEAGARRSGYDMLWINGETFYQLRQIDALWGPFLERLPSARYVDLENPFIGIDFQQPIDGYEAPWGNVQMAVIYDAARVDDPPRTPAALAAWVKAHPGRFTLDAEFTGMTFLKGLLAHFAGGPEALNGPFDEATYEAASAELWDYLRQIQPYLWQRGETFPANVAQMHQLYAAGEVDFTMSNNDGEVDNKVLQGLFPATSRAYVFDTGSIQNSHYWGIPARADDKAGALVAINVLMSPEAQFEKAQPAVWGDGTVLDLDRLPAEWQARFAEVPGREHAPPRGAIADKAIQEPDAEYMIRLYEDFRRYVMEGV